MDFTNRVCQSLHDEHMATLALFERVEQLLGRHKRGDPPDAADPGVARLLRDLRTWVDTEIKRHFDFEEAELFTYLDEHGDKALNTSLTGEHRVIRPLGARLGALAQDAADRPFTAAKWDEFWRSGRSCASTSAAMSRRRRWRCCPPSRTPWTPIRTRACTRNTWTACRD